jgi:hypothetical protein
VTGGLDFIVAEGIDVGRFDFLSPTRLFLVTLSSSLSLTCSVQFILQAACFSRLQHTFFTKLINFDDTARLSRHKLFVLFSFSLSASFLIFLLYDAAGHDYDF